MDNIKTGPPATAVAVTAGVGWLVEMIKRASSPESSTGLHFMTLSPPLAHCSAVMLQFSFVTRLVFLRGENPPNHRCAFSVHFLLCAKQPQSSEGYIGYCVLLCWP